MARDKIIEKLADFLAAHAPLTEECHVVYLMVEFRKILDHEGRRDFPLLRFYCDWTVHTSKDRITPEMQQILEGVYTSTKAHIESPMRHFSAPAVNTFAYMQQLQEEVRSFLSARSLDTTLADGGWTLFVQLLVKILEDQPIVNPTDTISSFSFVPAADRCVRCVVRFKQPINGFDYYEYANAY